MEPRQLIEAFLKKEATNKPSRIISSFPDARFLVKFSSFTLAFRDAVLHAEENRHWFIPGLTPREIADKVMEYVSEIGSPMEGDYVNFDGSVSKWCQRYVMNAVYHRWFAPEYFPELQRCTDMLVDCPARAKNFGFRYDAGVGVKSGSPTTCDANTILNAFVQYASIRLARPDMDCNECYRSIGMAFGDDNLFDQQYKPFQLKVASDLGLKLECTDYNPEVGVTFLARVFVDPYKTSTSIQDPLRTWRKLHMTTRDPNIPLEDAALDRVEGYLTTDCLSPIVGAYCFMIKRVLKDADPNRRECRVSRNVEKPYWLTVGGAWPQDRDDLPLMYSVAAARTGVSVETIRATEDKFRQIDHPWFNALHTGDELPYTNTVDEDGGHASSNVDNRLMQNDRQKVIDRAINVDNRQGAMPSRYNPKPSEKPGRRRTKRQTRSRRLSSGDGKGSGENQKRDRQPARKADNSKLAKRPPGDKQLSRQKNSRNVDSSERGIAQRASNSVDGDGRHEPPESAKRISRPKPTPGKRGTLYVPCPGTRTAGELSEPGRSSSA